MMAIVTDRAGILAALVETSRGPGGPNVPRSVEFIPTGRELVVLHLDLIDDFTWWQNAIGVPDADVAISDDAHSLRALAVGRWRGWEVEISFVRLAPLARCGGVA